MADGYLKIQLNGFDQLQERLKKAPEFLLQEIEAEFVDAAQGIAQEAKQRAPVNYGILKNLIIAGLPQKQGNLTSIRVSALANYSAFVEFGTGTKVDVPTEPEGLPEYALQFKGTHEIPGMHARPYFFPSVLRQKPIIISRLKKILAEL
jgi:HK97 gp10 family phage protein